MAFTSLVDEETLLTSLAASPRVAVDVIGQSIQGRDIRLVRIGIPGPPAATDRPAVLHLGLQHGNEPAGREAILQFAQYLESTEDDEAVGLLESRGVFLIPTINPDGFEADTRLNAADADLNRDWVRLSQPETQAVSAVIGQARPLVVVDQHEFVGGGSGNIVEANRSFNPQAHELIGFHSGAMRDAFLARADDESWANGLWGASNRGDLTVADINATLRHCAAIIVETDRDNPDETLRTDVHYAACEEVLAYVAANLAQIAADVATAETDKAAEGAAGVEPFNIRGGNVLDPPPLAYQLTANQVAATALHRSVYGITLDGDRVLMGQRAQPIIPFLLDPLAAVRIVSATRLFSLDGDGSGSGPPPVAEAAIRRRVTWLGVHAVTGRIIAELPDVRGSVGRLLSAYRSAELNIPIPLAGPGALPIQLIEQATGAPTAAIVAVVNDIPVWMGWVLPRRGGTEAMLTVGAVTPEGYLRRRRVRTHAFVDRDRAQVAATLVGDAEGLDSIGGGLGFDLDVENTGDLISPVYLDTDRQTVYDAVRELAAGGLEFTVDLDWADAKQTAVRKILRLRPRIGKPANGTAALFETTASSMFESTAGSEATYNLLEDYSSGRYANHITAIGPGEGEDQPASTPAIDQAALDAGAPIVEDIIEVSSAAATPIELDAIAQAELARKRRGAQLWDISVRLDAYPRLGVDAMLGDDVAWRLTGHRHPTGVTGSGRMVGFELDEQSGRWTPDLLDPQGQVI